MRATDGCRILACGILRGQVGVEWIVTVPDDLAPFNSQNKFRAHLNRSTQRNRSTKYPLHRPMFFWLANFLFKIENIRSPLVVLGMDDNFDGEINDVM